MGIKELLKKVMPVRKGDKEILRIIERYVSEKKIKQIKRFLKEERISIGMKLFNTTIVDAIDIPLIKSEKIDVSNINKIIKEGAMENLFEKFRKNAFEVISSMIAPNIVGLDNVKKAVALQLFSKQVVHVLLLGDPGTGKSEIIRSAYELHPVSTFGLGSGTSGAGLIVTVKGNEIIPGLIPNANNGICCIDELNLMKEDSRAGLYNAMEKGFVTYDKAGHHYRFDARVKIAATANPKGDEFKGKKIAELKKQMPFDPALLTRFHVVFLIRKPDVKGFKEIASNIVDEKKIRFNEDDIEFIKSYFNYSNKVIKDIRFSDVNKIRVVNFVAELKKKENKYLIEISPRIVIGIMRLCKALAKIELRDKVEKDDIERVKDIIIASLNNEIL